MTAPIDPSLPPPPAEAPPITSRSEARTMASIIAKAVREGTPVSPDSVTPSSEQNAPPATPAIPAVQGTPGAEAVAQADEQVLEQAIAENPEEVARILAEAGIDLGITRADLPAELHTAYDRLTGASIDIAQTALAEHLQASEIRAQFDEFKARLESSPDKLLLAIAVSKPDIFQKVVEVFAQMQADPRVQEMVQRELQSEARLQEVTRREKVLNENEARTQARQVIAATKRYSRSYGVDYNTAEKVVALAVQANEGRLDASDVEEIVKDLRPSNRPRAPLAPRVASPAAVQATRTAPTGSVVQTPAPPAPPAAEGSPGLTKIAGSRFRQLIRSAGDRVRSAVGGSQ